MKLAVFSDIHSNYSGFHACVEQAQKEGADHYLFLGDYVTDGPYPRETLELLYCLKECAPCWFLRGNREEYMLNHRKGGGESWSKGSRFGSLLYTYEQLQERDFDFLESLPEAEVVRLGDRKPLHICHGSPRGNFHVLKPGTEEAAFWAENSPEPYILCGHTHRAADFTMGNIRFLNFGSAGLSCNGSPAVSFGLAEPDGRDWHFQAVAVDYPMEAETARCVESGLAAYGRWWTAGYCEEVRTGKNFTRNMLLRVQELAQERGTPGDYSESFFQQAAGELGIAPIL